MPTIQLNRTKNGTQPTALADGELYIDQLNGKLYWINSAGQIKSTDLIAVGVTAAQMPAFSGAITTSAGSTVTALANSIVTFAKLASGLVASSANFLANASSVLLSPNAVWSAAAFVPVTYASTVTLDMSTFVNASITLTGNLTLAAPTNAKPGQCGSILLTQDASGSRTLTLNSVWKAPGGAVIPLSTAGGKVDRLDYLVVDSSNIHYSLTKGVA